MNNIVYNITEDQNIFFTSDTHFGHENIMRFCNRPFLTVEEMNETLIKNWNSVVRENDIVFHLGDFFFCNGQAAKEILDRLNGHIHVIIGNHDWKNMQSLKHEKIESINQQLRIRIDNQLVYLNHFPLLCFDGTYRKTNAVWQLFGHVHSGPNSTGLDDERLNMLFKTQYDVGVDNNGYTPISFDEVKLIIENNSNQK